jgi:hypothetical protein
MSAIQHPPIYEELVELLARHAKPKEILGFQLSVQKQRRLDKLLEQNRKGNLTEEEAAELDAFEQFEHVVRLLKARLRGKKKP